MRDIDKVNTCKDCKWKVKGECTLEPPVVFWVESRGQGALRPKVEDDTPACRHQNDYDSFEVHEFMQNAAISLAEMGVNR